jgi:signal transduction histidine kinase
MGTSVEHLDRLVDCVHRVQTRLTGEVSGLGRGLMIWKRSVEMHGGSTRAENRPNGRKSDFHECLPTNGIPGM